MLPWRLCWRKRSRRRRTAAKSLAIGYGDGVWSRGPPEESDYDAGNPSLSKNARLRSFAATTNLSNEITSTYAFMFFL